MDGVLTAYFLHKGNWQSFSTRRISLPAKIAVGASVGGGGTTFAGQQVIIDFDNFSVTGVDPVCPPGSPPPSPPPTP